MIEFIFWSLVVWYLWDLIAIIFIPAGTIIKFNNANKLEMLIKLSLLYILFSHFYKIGGF